MESIWLCGIWLTLTVNLTIISLHLGAISARLSAIADEKKRGDDRR